MADLTELNITVTEYIHAMCKEQDHTWCYDVKGRLSYGLTYFYKGFLEYSDSTTTISIRPNSVLWLPKGQTYKFRTVTQDDIGFVALSFMATGGDLPFRMLKLPDDNKEIPSLFYEILTLATRKESGHKLAVKSKITWLIYKLFCLYADASISQTANSADLKESISYIHGHLDEKITLAQLSSVSGYSQSYYRRRFQQEYGMPPVRYINLKRVEKAKKLLLSSLHTKGEIAQICGFENQQFFARVFKKYTGKTPSAFSRESDYNK